MVVPNHHFPNPIQIDPRLDAFFSKGDQLKWFGWGRFLRQQKAAGLCQKSAEADSFFLSGLLKSFSKVIIQEDSSTHKHTTTSYSMTCQKRWAKILGEKRDGLPGGGLHDLGLGTLLDNLCGKPSLGIGIPVN